VIFIARVLLMGGLCLALAATTRWSTYGADLGQRPIGLQAFATWNLGAHLVNALPALEKQAPSEQLHQAKGDETSADKLAAWLASPGAPAVRDWHFARLGARQQCFVSKSACWRPNARAPPAGIV